MNNTGIIIQARLGSTRLPKKVLKEIHPGITMLEYMVNRIRSARSVDNIIVATTDKDDDNPIYELCLSKGIQCFRGSEDDVLKRYYDCAKKNKLDTVVRLTADCPLVDPFIIDQCVNTLLSEKFDYFSNTCPVEESKYPDGSDVEVFSYSALKKANENAFKKEDREHVTFYFWKNNSSMFRCGILKGDHDYSNYRYTVDYPEDFDVVSFIAEKIKEKNIQGSIFDIIKILDQNNDIKNLNSEYYAGIGWEK